MAFTPQQEQNLLDLLPKVNALEQEIKQRNENSTRETAIKCYEFYRAQIQHEDTLLNQRTTLIVIYNRSLFNVCDQSSSTSVVGSNGTANALKTVMLTTVGKSSPFLFCFFRCEHLTMSSALFCRNQAPRFLFIFSPHFLAVHK
jgi:hypothetical protein